MAMLLYDADCGFCTRSAGWLQRLRLGAEIRPFQSVDLARLGIPAERAAEAIPFVSDDGAVSYGHAAIAAALRTGAPPVRLVGAGLSTWPISRLAAVAYRWIARHRYQLPGGTAACRVDTPR